VRFGVFDFRLCRFEVACGGFDSALDTRDFRLEVFLGGLDFALDAFGSCGHASILEN